MSRFKIISTSKSYHYTSDSLEAAEYILSIGRNFSYVDYGGYSTRNVSNNTWQQMQTAISYANVKSLADVLEVGYKEVMAGGVY